MRKPRSRPGADVRQSRSWSPITIRSRNGSIGRSRALLAKGTTNSSRASPTTARPTPIASNIWECWPLGTPGSACGSAASTPRSGALVGQDEGGGDVFVGPDGRRLRAEASASARRAL